MFYFKLPNQIDVVQADDVLLLMFQDAKLMQLTKAFMENNHTLRRLSYQAYLIESSNFVQEAQHIDFTEMNRGYVSMRVIMSETDSTIAEFLKRVQEVYTQQKQPVQVEINTMLGNLKKHLTTELIETDIAGQIYIANQFVSFQDVNFQKGYDKVKTEQQVRDFERLQKFFHINDEGLQKMADISQYVQKLQRGK